VKFNIENTIQNETIPFQVSSMIVHYKLLRQQTVYLIYPLTFYIESRLKLSHSQIEWFAPNSKVTPTSGPNHKFNIKKFRQTLEPILIVVAFL